MTPGLSLAHLERPTASLMSAGLALVACTAFGTATPARAALDLEGPWLLYVTATGDSLGTYQGFSACAQAMATRPKGTLGCKPDPAPPLPVVVSPPIADVPPPIIEQPPVVTPPVMNGGITIDASNLPLGIAGYAFDRVQPTTEVAPVSDIGAFRTSCAYSHMGFDDPIVYPGQPGASHLHTFFGNSLTSAATTAESLRSTGNSTCRGGTVNRSAYWVPTMIDTTTGRPVVPDNAQIYYKRGYQVSTSTPIKAMPTGLRMIAGNPTNTTPVAVGYRFRCQGGPNNSNDQYGTSIPSCDAGAQMVQEIFFPQCWDGRNLDAPDHKSHMSYPVQLSQSPFTWSCPASHPVVLPQVAFNVAYTVPSPGAAKAWRLASDMYDRSLPAGYSSHGDWFNGWNVEVSDAWARACVDARRDCHSHLIGDGREMY